MSLTLHRRNRCLRQLHRVCVRSQRLNRLPLPPALLPPALLPRFDVPHEPLSSGGPDRLVGAPPSTSMSTSRSNSQRFLLIEIRNSATRSTPLYAPGSTKPVSSRILRGDIAMRRPAAAPRSLASSWIPSAIQQALGPGSEITPACQEVWIQATACSTWRGRRAACVTSASELSATAPPLLKCRQRTALRSP